MEVKTPALKAHARCYDALNQNKANWLSMWASIGLAHKDAQNRWDTFCLIWVELGGDLALKAKEKEALKKAKLAARQLKNSNNYKALALFMQQIHEVLEHQTPDATARAYLLELD